MYADGDGWRWQLVLFLENRNFPLYTNGVLQDGGLRQIFPPSSFPSFFFVLLLLIIKQDFTCHVNASITFDTVISDLSSWVKLSAEVPGQTSLIRKKVTLPQVIRIQSVWVPPGNWFWKEQLMEVRWGGLMCQHQVPGQQVSPGRS